MRVFEAGERDYERPEARVGQSTFGGPACDSSGWNLDLVEVWKGWGSSQFMESCPQLSPSFSFRREPLPLQAIGPTFPVLQRLPGAVVCTALCSPFRSHSLKPVAMLVA